MSRLVHATLSVLPLAEVQPPPVHIVSSVNGAQSALERLLNRIAAHTGSPAFCVLDDNASSKLTIFERIVSDYLRACGPYEDALPLATSEAEDLDSGIETAAREDFDRKFHRDEISSFDGATLRVYTAGEPRDHAIIMISACGVPARLCESWIHFLAQDHFVLTWETRGLFGQVSNFDSLAWDFAAQAKDLTAVMDHFGVKAGHVMGLCGGAVVAAAAALASPQRVSSVSLWYGDFNLGPSSPSTMYQQNLREVMLLAGAGRPQAEAIHELFCGSMVKSARPDLAHLVLYPYATPELLFRYGKLNGSIMSADIASMLDKIHQRALVVTSQNDNMAHPASSREVAARLPNAVLHVEPHGDHLSFYDAGPHLTELASRFIDKGSI